MNKFNYRNLTPFKWFVLENFPFIEADFDCLTEWQLFCKLGKEMNKIINSENTLGTQMETITNAFIELQNYVNNYFDNLNVQDEINNKLNQMTEDGTFDLILENYFGGELFIAFPRMNNDSINANTNGDCTIVKTKNKVFICDTYYSQVNFVGIQETMNKLNINKIDFFLISHYDEDHYKLLTQFLDNYDCSNCVFLLPNIPGGVRFHDYCLSAYNTIVEELANRGLNHRIITNETLNIDNVVFNFFNGSLSDYEYYDNNTTNYNNYSICTEILYKDKKILLTGDIDSVAQERIATLYCNSDYDIIKDPHHGISNINQTFAKKINPKYVVETMTKGLLTKSYNVLKYPNLWSDYNAQLIFIGYQNTETIFKVNVNGIDLITKNYFNNNIDIMTDNYQHYYVDNINSGSVRTGTEDKPFSNIREALAFINNKKSQRIYLNIISIPEEDLNINLSITNFDYLVINGYNNILPNITINKCNFIQLLDCEFSNVDNEYFINCNNTTLYLNNVKCISNSANAIVANYSKIIATNKIDIQNKTNAIFILYNLSELLLNASEYNFTNSNYIISSSTSTIHINEVLKNYFTVENKSIDKLIPYNQLRNTLHSKSLENFYVLYDGEINYDEITLKSNYTNFSSIEIYAKDNDNRIKIVKTTPEQIETSVNNILPAFSANELYIKTAIFKLYNNNKIKIERKRQTTISSNGAVTNTEVNSFGIFKVIGKI